MHDAAVSPSSDHPFLVGGGELGEIIASYDWASTPLGPLAQWPQSLKAATSLVLRAHVPIVMLWGVDGIMIYNDAYSVFAAGRHPRLLGSKVREGWHEVADFNDHVMKVGLAGGTLAYKDQELTLLRNGVPEQVWMNLDYSPLSDDSGRPAGVIAIVIETTAKVRAERWQRGEQERLRHMFEQAPGFMALLGGPEHRFEMVNAAYERLIGSRQVIGQSVANALPDAARQGYVELLDRVYRTGEAFAGESAPFAVQARPGEAAVERFVDFVYQPLRDESGAVTGIFVQGSEVTDRVKAASNLERSEAQFRALAQAVPNQVWTARADGLLDWCNDRVYEYSRGNAQQLLGSGWADIVHPDDLDLTAKAWQRALWTGTTYEVEFRLRRHDGAYRWHLARAVPTFGADQQADRWVGTNTDIHERKLVETANSRDRDRMWAMTQDLLVVSDFEGRITAVNPTAQRILGWPENEMIGHRMAEFVHPEDLESSAREAAKLRAGRVTLAFENRFRTRQGGYRLFDWTAVPDAERIHSVGRDITDERDVARDQERIWTLSPVLKVVAQADGLTTKVNPAWTAALGWPADQTVGRRFVDFVSPAERESSDDLFHQLAAGRSPVDKELTMLASPDGKRQIAWNLVREGSTVYGFGRDVTEQRAAEDALRQSQKMEAVGQLTGGIAHDFNNLLQGITGSLELLQMRISQGRTGELDRFIKGAMTSASRASALTHRLLAFSRRQPLDPRPVRANPLVASMEDLLRRTLGERIELELVLAGGLWLTRCDPNQLESAILNLAINARDAMPDGGTLVIETCNAHLDAAYVARQKEVRPGQYVCICVTDTGSGMSADTIVRAFEPFFTTKPIGQGTGLGLSMIYGFTQQSEGYAKIYSELGKGTTVKLYLPRFRGEADDESVDSELDGRHETHAGETVLVVEDEPVVRGLIVEVLNDLGYQALEASDGLQGLALLQSTRRIDLLVTDVGLPGLNGRQLADAGRALRPGLKVLFMTGYAENAALASGFLEPGMAMITKPFAMEALATRIRDILEER